MSDLIPCLGITGSLAIIFGFFAFLRYMNYKETITLAEKGLTRPETKTRSGLLRVGNSHHRAGACSFVGTVSNGFFFGR